MQHNFNTALKRVLVHEGGKVDDPRDPGGRTNQGVTQRVFNGWLSAHRKKARDVYTMTNAERDAIYRAQYWDAVKGDKLPDGVDYAVFDGAVHSGSAQSIKWLQRAVGGVNVDGVLGQMTLAAVAAHPNPVELIDDIEARRLAFLKALKPWPTYRRGWTSRVEAVRKAAQAMAIANAPPKATFFAGGNVKAPITEAKATPKTVVSDASAGGGAGITGTITWAQTQLEPIQTALPYLDHIFAGLVVAGVVATVGGVGWSWYARRKAAALKDALDTKEIPKNDIPESTI